MAPVRNEPQPVSTPVRRPTPTSTPTPTPQARAPARPTAPPQSPQADRFEAAHNRVSQAANGVKSVSDTVAALQHGNTRGARWSGGVGTAASVAQLPGAAYLAYRDTRDFFRNPSGATANKAGGSVASAASTGLNVAKGTLETAGLVSNHRAATHAARAAFTQAAPGASHAVANRVATAAAREALDGGSRQVVRAVAARVAGEGMEAAGRLGANAARAAVQGGGTAVARAAGRFAPGLNVAIAAADTAAAVSTFADPTASPGKKVTAGITAAGSILAATNIPVVSQAGAVASTVSSFVGSFF